MRRSSVVAASARGSEAEALGDAEVVGVDAESAAAEGGEVDDGGGDLIADAFELLEPGADFFGAVLGEEVEGEGADAGGDLFEESLRRRAFCSGKVTMAMARSMSGTEASRTGSQLPGPAWKARSRSRMT